jgi:hypothetical protein
MPRDIEGLKESILETDGVGSLSLASTLMGSDSSKSFCEIFVVMKIAEIVCLLNLWDKMGFFKLTS